MTTTKTLHRLEERREFLERCSRCSQCKFVLNATSKAHVSACPSIDFGQWHAHSASGQIIMGYGLMEGVVPPSAAVQQAVSSCTMCGHCDVSCKTNFGETVEPLDSLYALRAKLAETGQSPKAYSSMMDNLRRQGNAAGRDKSQRGQWAQGLSNFAAHQRAEVLLHIGSTLAFDKARWASLHTAVKALQHAGLSITHLGEQEGSSGSTAFDLGFVAEAKAFAQQMLEGIRASGATTVVTFSAPAYAAFRAVYPRLGIHLGNVRVLHFSEYFLELLQSGKLRAQAPSAVQAQAAAFHDSCKLGRLSEPWKPHDLELDRVMNGIYLSRAPEALRFGNDGCYEPPRALLRALGVPLEELPRSRASSYCCGGCGGVKEAEPGAAALAARNRLSELDATSTPVMISGCSGCSKHMAGHAKAGVQVMDMLDVLAQSLSSTSITA